MEPNNQPLSEEELRQQNEEMLAFLQGEIATKIAKSTYVVMNRSRSTLVKDPGLNRPFAVKSKLRAEQVARQVGGVVETMHDAIQHLINAVSKRSSGASAVRPQGSRTSRPPGLV